MEIASLIVIQGVRASWGGSVIARRLVGEGGEGERVWIEERGREAPWLMLRSRRRIEILYIFVSQAEVSGLDHLLVTALGLELNA